MPNQFMPFAGDPGANVMPIGDYLDPAFITRNYGFVTGTALSIQLNRVWRQASLISSMVGNFVGTETGLDMLDDGTASGMAALETNFRAAIANVATTAVPVGSWLPITGGTLTGNLGIDVGVGENALLGMNRFAGQYAYIQANTAGSARWQIMPATNEAETGGNAGSNFSINRFDDAGTYLGAPLSINRATGVVNFTTPPTVNGDFLPYLPLVGGNLYGAMGVGGTGIRYQGVGWQNYMAFGWDSAFVTAAVDGTYIGQLATVGWSQSQLGNYLPIWGGQVTGNLGVSGAFVVDGGAGFRSSVWFANLGDFINFWDGRYRFRQWAGEWYEAWDGQTGIRAWSAPGAWIMTLAPGGHLWTAGSFVANGGRIISNNWGTVAVHAPGAGAAGFWWDQGLWLGWTDGGGNPTAGRVWIGTDGWMRVWDGIAIQGGAGLWSAGPLATQGGLYVAGSAQIDGNVGVSGQLTTNGGIVTWGHINAPNGNLDVGGAIYAGAIVSRGTLYAGGGEMYLALNGNQRIIQFAGNYYFMLDVGSGTMDYMRAGALMMRWQGDGAFGYYGSPAYKFGGGDWWTWSDRRIKTIDGGYTKGMAALREINPVRYHYKPNSLPNAPTTEFVGLIAQDVEDVMPEMVHKTEGTIDGHTVHDLRGMDTTALTYAMLNAIKEMDARLTKGGM